MAPNNLQNGCLLTLHFIDKTLLIFLLYVKKLFNCLFDCLQVCFAFWSSYLLHFHLPIRMTYQGPKWKFLPLSKNAKDLDLEIQPCNKKCSTATIYTIADMLSTSLVKNDLSEKGIKW